MYQSSNVICSVCQGVRSVGYTIYQMYMLQILLLIKRNCKCKCSLNNRKGPAWNPSPTWGFIFLHTYYPLAEMISDTNFEVDFIHYCYGQIFSLGNWYALNVNLSEIMQLTWLINICSSVLIKLIFDFLHFLAFDFEWISFSLRKDVHSIFSQVNLSI